MRRSFLDRAGISRLILRRPGTEAPAGASLALGLLAMAAFAAGAAGGCRRAEEPPAAPARGASRIVVVAPAAAEILDRLGAADRIVAVGDFVDWPPQVARLPKVGAYDNPNVERVLELEADLLLTVKGRAGGAVHDRLEKLGVRVVALDTETYRGVLDAVASVGRLVGREEAARAEAGRIARGMEEVRRRAAGAPRRR